VNQDKGPILRFFLQWRRLGANSTIACIDDDSDVRASVGRLLQSLSYNVNYLPPFRLFKIDPPDGPLPGAGRQFAEAVWICSELAAEAGTSDHLRHGPRRVPDVVQAMKGGAIQFD
jgi:hypothetical protein